MEKSPQKTDDLSKITSFLEEKSSGLWGEAGLDTRWLLLREILAIASMAWKGMGPKSSG